jgi:hypothetical protein
MTACAAEATANCAKREQCQDKGATREFGGMDACTTRLTASCVAALAAPGQGNNPTAVTACAATITAATCAAYLDPAGVCPQQKGTGADGSACAYAGQCSTGFCATPYGAACGVCAELPKAGDACGSGCGAQALSCDHTTGTCLAIVAVGAKCDATNLCGPSADCVGADAKTMTQGTCTAEGEMAGAACDNTSKTAARCDRNAGLACNAMTKMCEAMPTATAGAVCGADKKTGTVTECSGGTCETPAGAAQATCVAYAADGAACDTNNGPVCTPQASCIGMAGAAGGSGVTGTCQLPSATACK